jgi:hypothetical protein
MRDLVKLRLSQRYGLRQTSRLRLFRGTLLSARR